MTGACLLTGGTQRWLASSGSLKLWNEIWGTVLGGLELRIGAAAHEKLDVLEREVCQAMMEDKEFALSAGNILVCFVEDRQE